MDFNATFIVTIISFLAFMYIMNKIFYTPLNKIRKKRNEIIIKNNKDAEYLENKAQMITDKMNMSYNKAIKDITTIMNGKINEANFNSQKNINEAKDKSLREMIDINRQLKAKEDNAQIVLDSRLNGIAELITTKILKGGNID